MTLPDNGTYQEKARPRFRCRLCPGTPVEFAWGSDDKSSLQAAHSMTEHLTEHHRASDCLEWVATVFPDGTVSNRGPLDDSPEWDRK